MRKTLDTIDGRARRSERSRAAMVQALFDLVGEGVLQPTAQQVAKRAKVGIRTVFRHFSDMDSLLAEINERVRRQALPLLLEPVSAGGGREERARGLVAQRVRFFEQIAPYKRSGNVQRSRSTFIAGQHAALARTLRANLLGWLPELREGPPELLEALDACTSFELWDRMRTDQRLGRERATAALERIVLALLATLGRG
ncbi:MAG: TetR/AcrR family transcriptional regulator [Myxococcota bacterium]